MIIEVNEEKPSEPAIAPPQIDPYEVKKMSEWMRWSGAPTAKTQAELLDHILHLLDWYLDHEWRGTTLADLNRRFGKCAKSLGTSVRHLLEAEYSAQRTIDLVSYRRSTVVISLRHRTKIVGDYEGMGMSEAVMLAAKIRENMLNASVGYVPPKD